MRIFCSCFLVFFAGLDERRAKSFNKEKGKRGGFIWTFTNGVCL